MKASAAIDPAYLEAIGRLLATMQTALPSLPRRSRPLRLTIAGGAAVALYTGSRVSRDVDATLSLRVHLPAQLVEHYADRDGTPRIVYLDPTYNDTLGPLHENAHVDAVPLDLTGIDRRVLDVRVLTPIDLAISKLGRFAEHDRGDIIALATAGLLDARAFERRARNALGYYVGHPAAPQANLREALRLVLAHSPGMRATARPKRRAVSTQKKRSSSRRKP